SFTDITERKQAQAELEKANDRLKELDQLRSQFFADISHELRTPLTVIRGEAEVTLRGKDKPLSDYKTTLERIVQLTDEVNKLVSDLLFLARSETGTIQITKTELALENLLQDVLQEAVILAQKKHIMITFIDPPASGRIYGDPQRLKQLFLILLDNAIKYSDPNSHIQMGLNVDSEYATIEIVDQGQGIAEQDLPHIFDRFYRGHRVKDHTQPGAGLGLAIARWITEAHGGHISFSSRPGKGTTVTLRFAQQPLASEIEHETTPHRG
ncbi:MAG: HAMP domain-containing histidine kinase, partial [Nitrospirota bacterium]|nr:HAMP domain-containing histidine kinase [Nitrospirota bacterium]